MYIICIDFSENNLLTEQLNIRSFYDLPVFNHRLIQLQLMNCSDLIIEKAYLIDCENLPDFSLFESVNSNINEVNKILLNLKDEDVVLLLRNDLYFEFDLLQINEMKFNDNITSLESTEGICFSVIASVKALKNLYSKDISFIKLFKNIHKYADELMILAGYLKILNSPRDYKTLLIDILNDKTAYQPPFVAKGVFTNGKIPEGDFSIVPPVYIGDSVQIESDSVIGPNTIIYNETLVSKDSVVKNSLLFDRTFVSSDCYLDGVICCKNSSVKRNTAVFSNSIIGENALIGEDLLVENNSLIRKDVKYEKLIRSPFYHKDKLFFSNKFQGLSPDKAAILGSAIAYIFNMPKVTIGSDGSANSQAIKLALLSGLVASGAECFEIGNTFRSHVFFCSVFCECDYSIFISGKTNGTNNEVFTKDNEPLSKSDCCNISDYCRKGELTFVGEKDCRTVRQIHGLRKMYIRKITGIPENKLIFKPVLECKNKILLKTCEEIFEKTTENCMSENKFYIHINDKGDKIEILHNGEKYSQITLKKIIRFYNKEIIDLSEKYYKLLIKNDCIIQMFLVFDIMNKTGKDISELVKVLPSYFIETKYIKSPYTAGKIAKKIDAFKNSFFKNGCYNIPLKNGLIKIKNNSSKAELKVLCVSENSSFSKEICDFLSNYFNAPDA